MIQNIKEYILKNLPSQKHCAVYKLVKIEKDHNFDNYFKSSLVFSGRGNWEKEFCVPYYLVLSYIKKEFTDEDKLSLL